MSHTVLVTGGAGFIGAHVTAELMQAGHQVVVLDDLSGGFAENVPEEASFVRGSILDEKLIESLFRRHAFSRVYHLAAYAAEGLSHFIRRFNYTNNVVGSINLINASINHDVECFVFTSSIAVYGANQLPMSEELIPHPEDPYGIAKRAVELDLMAAQRMFDLDYIIFRPHNVYGEFQNIGDRYRNVVGIFMRQAMLGEPFTVFGDGSQSRAFTHVADVASAIAGSPNTAGARNEIFNIGADTVLTVSELAEAVAAAMGVELRVSHLEARHEVQHAYATHDKVRRILGDHTEVAIAEGLRRMADWAKRVGPRKTPPFQGVEVVRNLPQSWQSELSPDDSN